MKADWTNGGGGVVVVVVEVELVEEVELPAGEEVSCEDEDEVVVD
jgi:hypothetical protein